MYDLVIDARMQKSGGIGTYLQNLLPYLESSGLRLFKITSKEPIYSLQEQWKLPLKIPPALLFWSPHFNIPLLPILPKRRVVTIHDFYHLSHLKELSLLQRAYAKVVISKAVKKASRLIVISAFTQNQLYHFFPGFQGRVDLIMHGPGALPCANEELIVNLPSRFFLFVGNLKPHKNLATLIQAFESLQTEEHLLVVGKKEGMIRGIDWKGFASNPKVHFLGEISREQLTTLYRKATALVFPSFYEGWGFPPIEAMLQGCPVIAAKAASIPEACGEAARYFNPYSSDELASLLASVDGRRAEYVLKGEKQAKTFCWQKCAKKHLEVIYEEIEAAARP